MANAVLGTPLALGAVISGGKLTPTLSAAINNGETITFANDGRSLVRIKANSTSASVVITTPKAYQGVLAIADPSVTLNGTGTEGGENILGPFDPDLFNDSSGLVTITCTFTGGTTTGNACAFKY